MIKSFDMYIFNFYNIAFFFLKILIYIKLNKFYFKFFSLSQTFLNINYKNINYWMIEATF